MVNRSVLSPFVVGTPRSANAPRLRRRLPRIRPSTGPLWLWTLHQQTFSGGIFAATAGDVPAICSSGSPAFDTHYPFMREDYSIDFPVTVPTQCELSLKFRIDDITPDESPEWDTIVAIQQAGTTFDLAAIVPMLPETASKHGVAVRDLCLNTGASYSGPGSNVLPCGLSCKFGQDYTLDISVRNGIVRCRDLEFSLLGTLGSVYCGFLELADARRLHYLNGSVKIVQLRDVS